MAVRNLLLDLPDDAGYALRQLARAPGFAAVVILTLALGIGANSAVFSVLNGVILEPLPYARPERLVNVTTAFPTMNFNRFWLSPPEFYELREWNEVFDEVGGYRIGVVNIETDERPVRVPSAVATWTLFPTLGVTPALGRAFTAEEDLMGVAPVALISFSLWQRGFGADPTIPGRQLRINGELTTILGVLPRGFDLEDAKVDVWRPLNRSNSVDPNDHANRRGNHFINVIARVSDGVGPERVATDLQRLQLRWFEQFRSTHAINAEGHPITTSSFVEDAYGDVRATILLLMGAVSFVLLIACANVANLLLAKSERRSGEVAVRVALGAGRGRLTRQFLTEGVILSLLGGGLGLILGQLGIRMILRVNPEGVPRAAEIGLDGRVVGFTLLVAIATGVLFGMTPLLSTTVARVGNTLRAGGIRATHGRAAARVRRGLIVVEIGLAVILLAGSALMIRSIRALQRVEAGFDPSGILTAQLSLPSASYPTPPEVGAFVETLLQRIRALPGVTAAAATSGIPLTQTLAASDTEFEGIAPSPDAPPQNVDYFTAISDGYLNAMGIRVLEGRGFVPSDALPEAPVLLVNQSLVRRFYGDQNALGRRIRPGGSPVWFTIVGIVGDVKQAGLGKEPATELFYYHPQIAQLGIAFRTMDVVLKTDRDPVTFAVPLAETVGELDPSLPLANVRTMDEHLTRSMASPRFLGLLLSLFAGVALLLAAVGTYSVMAYSVAVRTREVGIRMAMGAEGRNVRGLILRQGAAIALLGAAAGSAGAIGLSRLLASRLYEVSSMDPVSLAAAPVALLLVALLASYLPALRASRMDPAMALRED